MLCRKHRPSLARTRVETKKTRISFSLLEATRKLELSALRDRLNKCQNLCRTKDLCKSLIIWRFSLKTSLSNSLTQRSSWIYRRSFLFRIRLPILSASFHSSLNPTPNRSSISTTATQVCETRPKQKSSFSNGFRSSLTSPSRTFWSLRSKKPV